MTHLSASFSATLRVRLSDAPGSFARVANAIGEAGGSLGAIDLVRVDRDEKVRDVTVQASSDEHLDAIVAAVRGVEGVEVEHVSDRTFLLHLGGKLEVVPKTPLKTRDDLSMAYTPGVARVCRAIADDPESAWNLTIKKNCVAVVSDGTAVLGLGDIGPEAAMPVMEGKAVLFKEFAGVDAFPLCIATTDVDEIVAFCKAIAPTFGGINLEDISAPRCFEIEQRLRGELDIPVFHDDQHGTAIVTLAALVNALQVVGKRLEDVKIVMTGVGAAGIATADILLHAGAVDVIGVDRSGAVHRGRTDLTPAKAAFAERSNPHGQQGSADEVLAGADVFIGLSSPGAVSVAGVGADGEGRDRVRDGEPDSRGLAGGDRPACRGRRYRQVGLPQPDQQRARVPGGVPRSARRARERHHGGDEGRREPGARDGDPAGRARARVRDPRRLQPGGRPAGRRRGRRGSGARRRRPAGARVTPTSRRRGRAPYS